MLVMLMVNPRNGKEREGSDHRDRNGEQRNQRGAPVPEEDVDDQDHQQHG